MGRALAAHVLRDHVVLGGLIALASAPWLGPRTAVMLWLATVLVDADHYAMFVWRSGWRDALRVGKMLTYQRMLFASAPGPSFLAIDPLHTLEALVVLVVVSRLSPSWLLDGVVLGVLVHYATDVVHQARHGRTFARVYSVAEYAVRRRRLRIAGLSPDQVFDEILSRLGNAKSLDTKHT